jgi:tetratricopeptide (TPR) repeat protein
VTDQPRASDGVRPPSWLGRIRSWPDQAFLRVQGAVDRADARSVVFCLLFALVVASALMSWITTVLPGWLRGYALPLSDPVALANGMGSPFRLDSWGVVIGALGASGVVAALLRLPKAVFCLGVAVIGLCVAFVGHVAFSSADLVEFLLDGVAQGQNIKSFSGSYLQGNAKALEVGQGLTSESLSSRVMVGLTFAGVGWYVALLAGLLVAFVSGGRAWGAETCWAWLASVVLLGGLLMAVSVRPLRAEQDRLRGDASLARGEYLAATDHYAAALRWDGNLKDNPRYAYNLGAAHYHLGARTRAEAHIYVGDNYVAANEFLRASREYEMASLRRADWVLARRKRVQALIGLGVESYKNEKTYEAIVSWVQALEQDASQVQVHFFLAKAFLDIHRREQTLARAEARRLLDLVKDKLVRSDAYNVLGDSDYKSTEFVAARVNYRLSKEAFQLVKILINFNAMKGLQGM